MKKLFKYNHNELMFEKIKPKSYIKTCSILIGIFAILFTIGWFSGTDQYIVNHITNKTEITDTLTIHDKPFSEEALIELLKDCNVKYPYIVLAQAKVESGNFTSSIFRHNCNMFGMCKAHSRLTTAIGESDGFAVYRDYIDGVYDYCLYQSEIMCNVSNENEYFAKLGERYAQDTTYVSSLKAVINAEHLRQKFEE